MDCSEMTPACYRETWQRAQDRVLLYARALDLPPFRGIDLAAESLKRSGAVSTSEAMRTFRELMKEEGLDRGTLDGTGSHISSFPKMRRGIMVAEPLDRLPWLTRTKWFCRSCWHLLTDSTNDSHE